MQTPPALTDRRALQRNRARASRNPADHFLLHEVIADVQERLNLVNKSFTKPAIVTAFPDLWRTDFPAAVIIPDDDMLTLSPGAHDLVIHALALHWANDPVGQLVQCRRALAPDGLFLGFLLGGQTLHELRAALAGAEAQITGGLSPRVVPTGEIRDLGGLLQRAGLALPVADSVTRTVRYRDLWHLMADLRSMGEQNALAARLRCPTRREVFARAAQIYATTWGGPDGRIPATFDLIALTGWAAHDSQQQPLRPGSAVYRLADALRTAEAPLPRDTAKG